MIRQGIRLGIRPLRGWRLALRVARREALRHKGRSLLVVCMLALPVAGASAADTLWRSSEVTASEQAVRDMGGYDAMVSTGYGGGPMYQNADGSLTVPAPQGKDSGNVPIADGTGDAPEAAQLARVLPAGARIVGPMVRGAQAVVADATGRTFADLREVDLTDPLAPGIARHRAGTAPTAADQVAISTSLAAKLHKGVGDSISARIIDYVESAGPADAPASRTLRITGIYDGEDDLYGDQIFVRHGALPEARAMAGYAYFVALPGGMDWPLVEKLNEHGFTAESKKVVADPPPHSQMPLYTSGMAGGFGSTVSADTVAVVAIALAMVLLEVVLLAGPAFAVSARRRRRDFGLLGAAGADGRRLRRVVLADGVVLGLAGGIAGVAVGLASGAAALPFFARLSHQNPGGFRVMPAELAAAAGVGVLTGVAAALAPAIVTARQHVLVALTGRRGQARPPWRMPVAGLVAVLAGAGLIGAGAAAGGHAWLVVAGIVVAELGVVACTPVLVSWSGRLGRRLPLAARLAVRDGARNRGRTAPAVAAIMAAVAGASAVAMILTSTDAQDRHDYSSDLRPGQGAVILSAGLDRSPEQLAAQLAAVLPTSGYSLIEGVVPPEAGPGGRRSVPGSGKKDVPETPVYVPYLQRSPAAMCPPMPRGLSGEALTKAGEEHDKDPRCVDRSHNWVSERHYDTGMGSIIAGGPETARTVLGRSDPAAESVLRAGGIVVFNPQDLYTAGAAPTVQVAVNVACQRADGGTTFESSDDGAPVGPPACGALPPSVTLPAYLAPAGQAPVQAIVAPGALDKLGVQFSPRSIIFDTSRMPTTAEQKRADDIAAAAGVQQSFYVERGYQGGTWIGLLALAAVAGVVMLGAAAVATGLAITDAQQDLETLAAVGARPRVRRALAGSQAAATAGLGALLGGLFGLLPAVGLLEAKHSADAKVALFGPGPGPAQLVVPWLFLLVVIVALPMLAAGGAAGMTRSRITVRQRRE